MRARKNDPESRTVLWLSWGMVVLTVLALALLAAFVDLRGDFLAQRRLLDNATDQLVTLTEQLEASTTTLRVADGRLAEQRDILAVLFKANPTAQEARP